MSTFNTPVILLVYNRPEVTRRLLTALAQVRPARLLVVADGPRSREDEARCASVREMLADVPWPCTIERNYSDRNMGVRARPATGLDWAFDRVEEAVILEDDCIPSPGFFDFCAGMLETYRHDTRIMQVGGTNFQQGRSRSTHGYYFSIYYHVWGWATWRRAWQLYDLNMARWPALRRAHLLRTLPLGPAARRHWTRIFDRTWRGELQTWDFQWQFAMWQHHGLAIVPDANLVSNVGFGPDATHTVTPTWHAEMPTSTVHVTGRPSRFVPDVEADEWEFRARHRHQTPAWQRIASRVRRSVSARSE